MNKNILFLTMFSVFLTQIPVQAGGTLSSLSPKTPDNQHKGHTHGYGQSCTSHTCEAYKSNSRPYGLSTDIPYHKEESNNIGERQALEALVAETRRNTLLTATINTLLGGSTN